MMPALQLHSDYNREQVHDIFDPESHFTSSAGVWGIQGIIPVKDRSGDFILFVSYGREQGDHEFDEGISSDGALRWQSQPSQSLADPLIQALVSHDETKHQIYLFLRTAARFQGRVKPYTYLGRLKYLTHDSGREHPVHFIWQLLNWPIPDEKLQQMGLTLEQVTGQAVSTNAVVRLQQAAVPTRAAGRAGSPTRRFQARLRSSSPEQDKRNAQLGLAGERAVVVFEKDRLRANERSDLADRVRHVSIIEGDGAGYDILSFKDDGSPLFIEVKTTRGPATTEFFISSNEMAFSGANPTNFELRRVYEFDERTNSGSFFSIHGNLEQHLILTPIEFRAEIR